MLISSWLAVLVAAPSAMAEPAASPQAKQIERIVKEAAALLEQNGNSAFSELRRPGSRWRSGNTYIFAYDMQLNVLFNPAFPERVGTNPQNERDSNGKAMHEEFRKVATTVGAGWVDYMFPRPGETRPRQKWSYVKRVTIDGKPAIIGAGFYPE